MTTKSTKLRSYSDMIENCETFVERFEYLNLAGVVGATTFGSNRHLNQNFYRSKRWKNTREQVIIRDNGCDLGLEGHEIHDKIIAHHIHPVTEQDIELDRAWLYDPEYIICTSQQTHNAIHYGDADHLAKPIVKREPGDTTPWK